jgi:hypothetical protein
MTTDRSLVSPCDGYPHPCITSTATMLRNTHKLPIASSYRCGEPWAGPGVEPDVVLLNSPGDEDPLLHQGQLTTQTTLYGTEGRGGRGG